MPSSPLPLALALACALGASACSTASLPSLPGFETSFAFRGPAPTGTLDAVNAARRSAGRADMRVDAAAQRAAERHARAMARAGRMAHVLPGGPGFERRMARDGIRSVAAENVAWGRHGGVARAVTMWMNSRPHRRNLLDRRFEGVGVASSTANDGRIFWAMVLVP